MSDLDRLGAWVVAWWDWEAEPMDRSMSFDDEAAARELYREREQDGWAVKLYQQVLPNGEVTSGRERLTLRRDEARWERDEARAVARGLFAGLRGTAAGDELAGQYPWLQGEAGPVGERTGQED